MANSNRETISVNDCQVLAHYKYDGEQYILTLSSSKIAQTSKPGQFVHITVSDVIAMRRPISVMSVDKENGSFDLLYKIMGGIPTPPPIRSGFFLSVTLKPFPIGPMTDNMSPILHSANWRVPSPTIL